MAKRRILDLADRAVGWAVDRMVDRLYGPIVPFLDVSADRPRPAETAPVDPAVSLPAGSGGIHEPPADVVQAAKDLFDRPPGRGHLPNDHHDTVRDESLQTFVERHPGWKEVLS